MEEKGYIFEHTIMMINHTSTNVTNITLHALNLAGVFQRTHYPKLTGNSKARQQHKFKQTTHASRSTMSEYQTTNIAFVQSSTQEPTFYQDIKNCMLHIFMTIKIQDTQVNLCNIKIIKQSGSSTMLVVLFSPIFFFASLVFIQCILFKIQACCAGCRRRPFPMQLHQQAKSTPSVKWL